MEEIGEKSETEVSISVVSHQQIHLVEKLLHDIEKQCVATALEVIVTLNLAEILPFEQSAFPFPVTVIRNLAPQGFAANHNQAFNSAKGKYFCVVNPDIRLNENPFPVLIACLRDSSVAVVGPLVINTDGEMEDSARHFPNPLKILCKAVGKCRGSDYVIKNEVIFPDWVGGMFMLFPHDAYRLMGGFEQKYFLYYEDVDLCARIWLQGRKVALCPAAKVVHEARRDSHRKMSFFKWHLKSMMRFFLSSVYWALQRRKYLE